MMTVILVTVVESSGAISVNLPIRINKYTGGSSDQSK